MSDGRGDDPTSEEVDETAEAEETEPEAPAAESDAADEADDDTAAAADAENENDDSAAESDAAEGDEDDSDDGAAEGKEAAAVSTAKKGTPPPRPSKDKDRAARRGPARPKAARKPAPKGSRKARRRRFGAPEAAAAVTLLLVGAQIANLAISDTKASTGAWLLLAALVACFLWACGNLLERRGRLAKLRNRGLGALALVLGLAVFSLVTVSVNQSTPQLGIDLRGGFSVTLTADGNPPSDSVDQAVEIIRNRIDGLGVAEPEVTRQGDAVVVNLPGVQDRDRALEIVGTTAKLEFRPVLVNQAAPYDAEAAEAGRDPCAVPEATEDPTSTTAAEDPAATSTPEDPTSTTVAEDPAATTAPEGTTASTEAPAGDEEGATPAPAAPAVPVDGEVAAPPLGRQETTTTTAPTDESTTTAADGETTTTAAPADGETTTTAPADPAAPTDTTAPAGPSDVETIPNRPEADQEPLFCSTVGPVGFEGSALSKAQAQLGGQTGSEWVVGVRVKDSQQAQANTLINSCFAGDQTACPTQQMAIVLDGEVISAPVVQNQNLADDEFVISGGSSSSGGGSGFRESEAKDLALKLRYGALPVEFRSSDEQQLSPSLGDDTLRAGILAGILGLVAVALYLMVYYRALGIVVVLGLGVWSALMYGVVCWLSATQGLTLSISGVVGIVVSLGTTVDSYVVHFERLKDEVRLGKSVRASTEKGFQKAFRTILTADLASLMGAVLLWWLTVGAVRGFAFFLGLSVVLDLFVAYCFDRPMVALLARSDFFVRHPVFGVARGLGRSDDDAPGRAPAGASS